MESDCSIQYGQSVVEKMQDSTTLRHDEAIQLSRRILSHYGYSADHTDAITRNLVKVQMDDDHAYGLSRLFNFIEVVRQKKVDPTAEPVIVGNEGSVIRLDAHGGNSLLGFETGLPKLIDRARQQGIAALSIHHTFHCSALWAEVEAIAEAGLVGLAVTPSNPVMAATADPSSCLGLNPIAFAWPRPEGFPYSFDLPTRMGTWARGESDHTGEPLEDHESARHSWRPDPVLSVMVELMAGPLIGDHLRSSIACDDETCADHGELIIALNPKTWQGARADYRFAQAEKLLTGIEAQGSYLSSPPRSSQPLSSQTFPSQQDPSQPEFSQPGFSQPEFSQPGFSQQEFSQQRFAARQRNLETRTMTIPKALYQDLRALLD